MAGANRVYAVIDRIEGSLAVVMVSVDALEEWGPFTVPKRIFPGAREGRIYYTTTGRTWRRDTAAEKRALAAATAATDALGARDPGGDINLSVIRVAPS